MKAEDAFLLLLKKLMPKSATVSIGTVESVDRDKHTCDVSRDGQPALFNCRLNAVIDTLDSFVVTYPKIGSYVLCITLDEPTACYVFAMSQVDEVHIKVGKSSVVIDREDIVLNGGSLGGMIKISELTAKLNAHIDIFNTHTHAVAGTVASATVNQSPRFNKGDYENQHVKQ